MLFRSWGILNSPVPPRPFEFTFKNETGTGLGPTLEFYSLSAQKLINDVKLWQTLEDGTLFPIPYNPFFIENQINPQELSTIDVLFRITGFLCAKSILDHRLFDFPMVCVSYRRMSSPAPVTAPATLAPIAATTRTAAPTAPTRRTASFASLETSTVRTTGACSRAGCATRRTCLR